MHIYVPIPMKLTYCPSVIPKRTENKPVLANKRKQKEIFNSVMDLSNENKTYRKVSIIRRTLVGNKIVDHSDVVRASPVGAAPTTSSFST